MNSRKKWPVYSAAGHQKCMSFHFFRKEYLCKERVLIFCIEKWPEKRALYSSNYGMYLLVIIKKHCWINNNILSKYPRRLLCTVSSQDVDDHGSTKFAVLCIYGPTGC